jgi:hypothetical protein
MRARTEALVAVGSLVVVATAIALLTSRGAGQAAEDRRPSAFLPGPYGTKGLAQGLERVGIEVRRFRSSLRRLDLDSTGEPRIAFAVLDPGLPLRPAEEEKLRAWNEARVGHDLVLAGRGAANLMRCYGYALDWRLLDSLGLRPREDAGLGRWPAVAGVIAASTDTVVTDSSRMEDVAIARCAVPAVRRTDTLLTTTSGRVAALRLVRNDGGGEVLLFSDAVVLRNRALRETPAGPFILGLFAGRYDRVIFDEAHQGFGAGGSLAGVTLDWSRRSPWGWAMWQLALVGVLALFAGAFRFGPARHVLERKRRSPLEHVRALATALAAARGHDVAIRSIVEGLRRRLQPAGQRSRGDWREWLAHLGAQVRSPRARDAVSTLNNLTRPGQSPEGVLRAANAVEDVWEELRP